VLVFGLQAARGPFRDGWEGHRESPCGTGQAAVKAMLSHRPAWLRLGGIGDAEPTADGHPGQGRLAAFEKTPPRHWGQELSLPHPECRPGPFSSPDRRNPLKPSRPLSARS